MFVADSAADVLPCVLPSCAVCSSSQVNKAFTNCPIGLILIKHVINTIMGMQVRCAEVARTLADLEASEECIAAALLHSVLDSSMLTEEKLRMSMCAEVADTVCNVQKLSGICQVN